MKNVGESLLIEPLTEREQDVLELLVQGKTNREIADFLVLSLNTVKWYNRQIYGKLGVENREQLVGRAAELGLFPTDKEAKALPNNLSLPLNKFIGRSKEIEQLKNLLSQHRLLTLTGSGGIGKTRLALALARHYLDQLLHPFTDGIYFVSLASLDDPARIISTIADVLNLRLQSRDRRSPSQQLLDYLQRKQMLLLLDNYEQLLSPEGIAPLLTLLSSAPGLTLLVTSRERLNIQGEQLFVVEGLRTPHAELAVGDRPPDEMAQAYSALQLFVHSARRVQPRFRLTSENLPAVVRVCQLVEGLPLAIELAAAWAEVLAPAQIAAEIEHSLDFLVAAWRDAPPRHRSLRAVFDSTWQRLSSSEQHVFARLAVFRGGFTRAAVEAVTGASWHVLLRLVVQALLAYQAERDRYEMHELFRQYATEQLPPDEAVLARDKHLTFFTELAEEAEPQLQGLEVATWLKRLDRDHDNLRTALQWMLDRGEAAWALRCCGALARFWLIRGYLSEGRRWVEAALTKGQQVAPHIQAKARFMAGLMAFAQSDYVHAATRYEESLAGFREVSDQQGVAEVLLARATLLGALEDERYVAALEESLALLRETGHTRGMAEALRAYGRRLANAQHDYARAMALCQQSLALAREVGDQFSIADALNSCGLVADADGEGDLEQAQAYYEESLALGRTLGHPMAAGKALNNLGEVARFLGEYERAIAYYEECLALWRQAGHRGGISVCLANLGIALLRTGDVARASACFKEGLPLAHDLGDGDKVSAITCLSGLAMIASLHGQPQRAARLLGAAAALVEPLKWPLEPLDASEHDRNVATVRAHVDEAIFEAAWEAGRAMSVEQAMADALDAVVDSEP